MGEVCSAFYYGFRTETGGSIRIHPQDFTVERLQEQKNAEKEAKAQKADIENQIKQERKKLNKLLDNAVLQSPSDDLQKQIQASRDTITYLRKITRNPEYNASQSPKERLFDTDTDVSPYTKEVLKKLKEQARQRSIARPRRKLTF